MCSFDCDCHIALPGPESGDVHVSSPCGLRRRASALGIAEREVFKIVIELWYNGTTVKVDRSRAILKRNDGEDDNFVAASPAECISFVWELTKEAWSLKNNDDVERRLQRHITHLVKTQS